LRVKINFLKFPFGILYANNTLSVFENGKLSDKTLAWRALQAFSGMISGYSMQDGTG
jgi:hypothetical protein